MIGRIVLLAAVLALLATGCGGTPQRPDYHGKPTDQLIREVEALPEVAHAHLTYRNSLDAANMFAGDVHLRKGADVRSTLDRILAILWQGPYDVDLSAVYVYPDKPTPTGLTAATLGLRTRAQFVDRYGPQPGDGEPPS